MAPKLLKSDEAGGASPKPSKESDVYAFGMVAYEVNNIIAHREKPESLPQANEHGSAEIWNLFGLDLIILPPL